MKDPTDPLLLLRQDLNDVIREVAELRAQLVELRRPKTAALEIDALISAVHQDDMLLSVAQARYGKPTVNTALRTRQIWRSRPDGGAVVLTANPAKAGGFLDIVGYLNEPVTRIPSDYDAPVSEGPRLAATVEQMRRDLNKNRLSASIDAALRTGQIIVGTIPTGQPGRQPKVIGLAGVPLPTHVDGRKVQWS